MVARCWWLAKSHISMLLSLYTIASIIAIMITIIVIIVILFIIHVFHATMLVLTHLCKWLVLLIVIY